MDSLTADLQEKYQIDFDPRDVIVAKSKLWDRKNKFIAKFIDNH